MVRLADGRVFRDTREPEDQQRDRLRLTERPIAAALELISYGPVGERNPEGSLAFELGSLIGALFRGTKGRLLLFWAFVGLGLYLWVPLTHDLYGVLIPSLWICAALAVFLFWPEPKRSSIPRQLVELPEAGPAQPHLYRGTQERGRDGAKAMSDSRRVFVVHGHDDGAKEAAARFLEKLRLEAVVLHEQPNGGHTIIEKFEKYADVAYAIVLLTPDDRGGTAATPAEHQTYRARQNVILELGYFLGKLGRGRVCALYKERTEIPSDFAGVLFVQMDAGGAWRIALGRELRQVISGIDFNVAL